MIPAHPKGAQAHLRSPSNNTLIRLGNARRAEGAQYKRCRAAYPKPAARLLVCVQLDTRRPPCQQALDRCHSWATDDRCSLGHSNVTPRTNRSTYRGTPSSKTRQDTAAQAAASVGSTQMVHDPQKNRLPFSGPPEHWCAPAAAATAVGQHRRGCRQLAAMRCCASTPWRGCSPTGTCGGAPESGMARPSPRLA